jgi:ketosteroid isomerase-like protein
MATHEDEVRKRTLELVQSYRTLIMQRRFDQWIELWADDGTCEFPYAPEGRPRLLQGKEQIYDYMTAYPDRIAIDSVVDMRIHPMQNPEVVAAELAIKGRALTTGRPYNQRYVIVVEARDGRIWRYREYWNPLVSIEAFGGLDGWLSDSPASEKGGAS